MTNTTNTKPIPTSVLWMLRDEAARTAEAAMSAHTKRGSSRQTRAERDYEAEALRALVLRVNRLVRLGVSPEDELLNSTTDLDACAVSNGTYSCRRVHGHEGDHAARYYESGLMCAATFPDKYATITAWRGL